jgi:hypothetical protein
MLSLVNARCLELIVSRGSSPAPQAVPLWGQCAGASMGQDLSRCCEAGSACQYSDIWYSQCVPAAQAGGSGGGERSRLWPGCGRQHASTVFVQLMALRPAC